MQANGRRTVVVCKWQTEIVSSLLDCGAGVYLVLDRYDLRHEDLEEELLDRCLGVYRVGSFDSLEELSGVAVDIRLRDREVDLVIGHGELCQFGAGYLGVLLGTVADPLYPVSHRDKRLMKQRVRDAGVPVTGFMSLPDATDRAAVAALAEALTMPVIVKPAAGYGSMSTVRAKDAEELAVVTADFTFEPLLNSKQLIVEEFVTGSELCVDAIWADGEPLTFVLHQYHTPRLAIADDEDAASMDGSRVLLPEEHPDLVRQAREIHQRINGVLGIKEGATHMETFIRPNGELVFSEIATRVSGGWIPDMLSAHLGHSIWSLVGQAAATGTCPPPDRKHRYIAGVHLRPEKPGVITSIPSDEEFAAFPGVISWRCSRKVGDRVRLSHPSEWYLFVVFGAETPEELEELRVRVARRFVIETAVPAARR
ncbi:hypothetical protein GCM10010282_65260 [Streptomyces roseolus]|nr:hypothetical protein GCM10010282_65260 [Streptomyces roseolus]